MGINYKPEFNWQLQLNSAINITMKIKILLMLLITSTGFASNSHLIFQLGKEDNCSSEFALFPEKKINS